MAERSSLDTVAADWTECAPVAIPPGRRLSVRPGDLRAIPKTMSENTWLAEIGVGVIHLDSDNGPVVKAAEPDRFVRELNDNLKRAYDPHGRFNPGVTP